MLFPADYVFSSNMRRYDKIDISCPAKRITTSNMHECTNSDFIMSFQRLALEQADIFDNSGLMALRMLRDLGVSEVQIAGMDGYAEAGETSDYYDAAMEYQFKSARNRNRLISNELRQLEQQVKLIFITPTRYQLGSIEQEG